MISNSTNAGEAYLQWCKPMIQNFCERHNVKTALFIPYAGVKVGYKHYAVGYDAYEEKVKDNFNELGISIKSLHRENNVIDVVKAAECVIVGGGNTFCLVYEMQRLGIMDLIAQRVREGMPYIGWSAGSNIASPTLCTTNDMPIVEPLSFKTMNLVPFQINPHYTEFFDEKHGGETRMDRINEFIEVNRNVNVVGIPEATALSFENSSLKLIGRNNKLKVFHYATEPKEYSKEDDINFLML